MHKIQKTLVLYIAMFVFCAAGAGVSFSAPEDLSKQIAVLKNPFVSPFAVVVEESKLKVEIGKPDKGAATLKPIVKSNPELSTIKPLAKKKAASAKPPELPMPVLKIDGMLYAGEHPMAIVNGKIVRVGDVISDVKIVAITKDGLNVVFHDKKKTIPYGN